MRQSPLRHPLAVLRQLIGLRQDELGQLCDCSARTIQAVELLKLPLSESLALRIAQATGVSVGWLLDGKPEEPPIRDSQAIADSREHGYTYEVFEAHRAWVEVEEKAAAGKGRVNTPEQILAGLDGDLRLEKQDAELLERCKDALQRTRCREGSSIVRWRMGKFFDQLVEEFIDQKAPATKRSAKAGNQSKTQKSTKKKARLR